jgi:hypothetical protein
MVSMDVWTTNKGRRGSNEYEMHNACMDITDLLTVVSNNTHDNTTLARRP